MKNDFEMIIKTFPRHFEYINLYAIGDTQVGSPNFDKELFGKWVKMVADDPYGFVVIVGDMFNNALKMSKSNSYSETVSPMEAKIWLWKQLKPIAHKILGGVRGNHEERSVNMTDDCPLYDVFAKLDIEDDYRENMAFINLSLGERNKDRQVNYNIVLGHGVSNSKTEMFSYAIDNMDIFITGHVHQPKSMFPSKIVIDPHNKIVRMVDFTHVIVPSFDRYGGYVLKGMYRPQSSEKIPIIRLDGTQKDVDVIWKSVKYM